MELEAGGQMRIIAHNRKKFGLLSASFALRGGFSF